MMTEPDWWCTCGKSVFEWNLCYIFPQPCEMIICDKILQMHHKQWNRTSFFLPSILRIDRYNQRWSRRKYRYTNGCLRMFFLPFIANCSSENEACACALGVWRDLDLVPRDLEGLFSVVPCQQACFLIKNTNRHFYKKCEILQFICSSHPIRTLQEPHGNKPKRAFGLFSFSSPLFLTC